MRLARLTAALLALSIVLGTAPARAYPIPPVPLWGLSEQADSIVVARVKKVEEHRATQQEMNDPQADPWERDVAVLTIVETWKGNPLRQVRVNFTASMMCPAPPRYIEGSTVLAFLERGETLVRHVREERARLAAERERLKAQAVEPDPTSSRAAGETGEENDAASGEEETDTSQWAEQERRWEERQTGRWLTVGLSYGTLYPEPADLPVYRDLVREAARLQSRGRVPDSARREWYLRAAERRATRWHGLYELAPATDALHSFYDTSGRTGGDPGLSSRELDRLARGFVREPSFDNTLPMALSLFSGYASREVDRAAVSVIEALLARNTFPWWTREAMAQVLARYADPDARARVGLDEPDCEEPLGCTRIDPPALPGIWREARRQLGIPDVAPARIPTRRVPGVGGETPD
jgi:hypothetical protein